jgi:hypothetical protein
MPDLTGFPALDLLIGTTVLFFLLALVGAAITEAIQAVINARGFYLSRGIRALLRDDGDETDRFFKHWRIKRLSPPPWFLRRWSCGRLPRVKERRRPSYIPARVFALSILDTSTPTSEPEIGADLFREAQLTIDRIGIVTPEGGTTSALGTTEQRQDALRAELERAFDEVMERTSGWYKRYVQWWLLAFALVVAFGLNINTATVGQRLWRDGALRPVEVQWALQENRGHPDPCPKEPCTEQSPGADHIDAAEGLQLPLGWNDANPTPGDDFPGWLVGCLMTAAALTLGAPFWFDVLTNFANLRGTGGREGIATGDQDS